MPKKRGTHKGVVLAPLFAFFGEACSTDTRHNGKDQGVTRKRKRKRLAGFLALIAISLQLSQQL